MFSPTKWVRSVVATAAIVVVITGAFYVGGRSKSEPTTPGASSIARAPDPETTSSVLKMIDHPRSESAPKR